MQNVTRTAPQKTPHINLGVNPSSLGATTLVAAAVGTKYRVLAAALVTTLANSVKFQSASTDITGTFPLAANGGLVLPFNEHGWFETATNEDLVINLSVATATGVQVQYIAIPVGV